MNMLPSPTNANSQPQNQAPSGGPVQISQPSPIHLLLNPQSQQLHMLQSSPQQQPNLVLAGPVNVNLAMPQHQHLQPAQQQQMQAPPNQGQQQQQQQNQQQMQQQNQQQQMQQQQQQQSQQQQLQQQQNQQQQMQQQQQNQPQQMQLAPSGPNPGGMNPQMMPPQQQIRFIAPNQAVAPMGLPLAQMQSPQQLLEMLNSQGGANFLSNPTTARLLLSTLNLQNMNMPVQNVNMPLLSNLGITNFNSESALDESKRSAAAAGSSMSLPTGINAPNFNTAMAGSLLAGPGPGPNPPPVVMGKRKQSAGGKKGGGKRGKAAKGAPAESMAGFHGMGDGVVSVSGGLAGLNPNGVVDGNPVGSMGGGVLFDPNNLGGVAMGVPIGSRGKTPTRGSRKGAAAGPDSEKDHPYVCDTCNRRFTQRCNLKRHMEIHLSVKRFHCETCQKMFHRKDDLLKHMRVHSGETPFACEHCGKKFNDRSNMVRHARIHDAPANVNPPPAGPGAGPGPGPAPESGSPPNPSVPSPTNKDQPKGP